MFELLISVFFLKYNLLFGIRHIINRMNKKPTPLDTVSYYFSFSLPQANTWTPSE